MNIWRVAGIALMAGLALFLITILVKLLLIGSATFLLVRVAGGRLLGRSFGPPGPGSRSGQDIISIDNPAYRTGMGRGNFDRVIAIS